MFVHVETKVVPATEHQLRKFSMATLKDYAKMLGVTPCGSKADLARKLVETGKATLCASVGN